MISNKTSHEICEAIRTLAGDTIFSCRFRKRSGEMRDMVCRLDVTKGVKGTGRDYDPEEHGLLPVWDVQKQAHRVINLEGLEWLKIRGQVYAGGNNGRARGSKAG